MSNEMEVQNTGSGQETQSWPLLDDWEIKAATAHIRNWQIVQGSSGWCRIEKHPEGHWLCRTGPYRTRDDARDCFRSKPIEEPTNRSSHSRPDIAFGHRDWYVVVETNGGRWAQLSGPFQTRAEAREWLSNYSQ
jgi:hypothetical protein